MSFDKFHPTDKISGNQGKVNKPRRDAHKRILEDKGYLKCQQLEQVLANTPSTSRDSAFFNILKSREGRTAPSSEVKLEWTGKGAGGMESNRQGDSSKEWSRVYGHEESGRTYAKTEKVEREPQDRSAIPDTVDHNGRQQGNPSNWETVYYLGNSGQSYSRMEWVEREPQDRSAIPDDTEGRRLNNMTYDQTLLQSEQITQRNIEDRYRDRRNRNS